MDSTDEEVKELVQLLSHPSIKTVTVDHMTGHRTLHTRGHRRVMFGDLYRHVREVLPSKDQFMDKGVKWFISAILKLLCPWEAKLCSSRTLAMYFHEKHSAVPISSLLLVNPHLLVPNPHGRKDVSAPALDQVVLSWQGSPIQVQAPTKPAIPSIPVQLARHLPLAQSNNTALNRHTPTQHMCSHVIGIQPRSCVSRATIRQPHVAPPHMAPVLPQLSIRSPASTAAVTAAHTPAAATPLPAQPAAPQLPGPNTSHPQPTDPSADLHAQSDPEVIKFMALMGQAAQCAAQAFQPALPAQPPPPPPPAPQPAATGRTTMPVSAVLRLLDCINAPDALKKTVQDFSKDQRIATSMVVWLLNCIAHTASQQAEAAWCEGAVQPGADAPDAAVATASPEAPVYLEPASASLLCPEQDPHAAELPVPVVPCQEPGSIDDQLPALEVTQADAEAVQLQGTEHIPECLKCGAGAGDPAGGVYQDAHAYAFICEPAAEPASMHDPQHPCEWVPDDAPTVLDMPMPPAASAQPADAHEAAAGHSLQPEHQAPLLPVAPPVVSVPSGTLLPYKKRCQPDTSLRAGGGSSGSAFKPYTPTMLPLPTMMSFPVPWCMPPGLTLTPVQADQLADQVRPLEQQQQQPSGDGAAPTAAAALPPADGGLPPSLGLPIAIPCPMGIPFYGMPPIGLDMRTMQMTAPYAESTPAASATSSPASCTQQETCSTQQAQTVGWSNMWSCALSAPDAPACMPSWAPAMAVPGMGLVLIAPGMIKDEAGQATEMSWEAWQAHMASSSKWMMMSPGLLPCGTPVEESQASDRTDVELQACKRMRLGGVL